VGDDDDGTKRGADAIDILVCEALSGGAFAVRFGASCELRCASRSMVIIPWQRIGLTERNSRRTAASCTQKPTSNQRDRYFRRCDGQWDRETRHARARAVATARSVGSGDHTTAFCPCLGRRTYSLLRRRKPPTNTGRPATWACGPFRLWIEPFRFLFRLVAQVQQNIRRDIGMIIVIVIIIINRR
jgi:hypothetical protein